MKENGQITETLLENEEFKKAYEELPSSVTKVVTYSDDDSIDPIELPKEK